MQVRLPVATVLALIHAASGELQAKRLSAAEIESALVASVLGALGATTGSIRHKAAASEA
jgi:hypothetical protein